MIDQKFKARYADNLYVVDASVFPIIASAVPNPTVMMPANALRLG